MFAELYTEIMRGLRDELDAYRDRKLSVREFRRLLGARHHFPKKLIKKMEKDMHNVGFITRSKRHVVVHWPMTTQFTTQFKKTRLGKRGK